MDIALSTPDPAIGLTLGELRDDGFGRVRIFCEECGLIDFSEVQNLEARHGRQFLVRRIACDACGQEDLLIYPSFLERRFSMPHRTPT